MTRGGEGEDAPVDGDEGAVLADARKVRGVDEQQRAHGERPEDGAEDGAGGREQDAFGEQLADEAAAAGADGGADGHLATTVRWRGRAASWRRWRRR